MASINKTTMLGPGATTNQTSGSFIAEPDAEEIGFQLVCEAIGATPAITWKIQASLDPGTTADANAMWFDMPYVTDATATESVAARSGPIVANTAQVMFLSLVNVRMFRRFRVVISGIVNLTYRVEMHTRDSD